MPSRQTIGVAPLLTGMLLVSRLALAIIQSGLSFWSVSGFVGGCAAIFVGLGILLEWDVFDQNLLSQSNPSGNSWDCWRVGHR